MTSFAMHEAVETGNGTPRDEFYAKLILITDCDRSNTVATLS